MFKNSKEADSFSQHRFLDEAGDTTFYGKGKRLALGEEGVSKAFIIGMAKFKESLIDLRYKVLTLQTQIENDSYYDRVPSILKKKSKGGYFFHAKDDIPEARKVFFELIKDTDFSFEAVVARKIPDIFIKKHNRRDAEFYADILSHLLKNKLDLGTTLILNIAQRGSSTRNSNLVLALEKASRRYSNHHPKKHISTEIVFNIQNPIKEPLLCIADYCCWSIQRVFEKGETRYYDYLMNKISLVIDLYDSTKYEGSANYYTKKNPLTSENKISPYTY